jgi:hypothetical protein
MSSSSKGAKCNLNWLYNNFLHDKFPFNPKPNVWPSMQVEDYRVDHFWAILWQIKTMLEK